MFTEADIADLRETVESAMPQVGKVYDPPQATEADQGEEPVPSADWRDDYTLVHQSVPFRLENTVRQAREEIIAGKLTATGKWILACPVDYNLTTTQRVELTDINRVFEIIGPVSGSYTLQIEHRYECDEVT